MYPLQADAVRISPTRHALLIDPGQQKYVSLEVENDSDTNKGYIPTVDAFITDERTGVAHFGQEEEAIDWVFAQPERLRLAPGEKGTFIYYVQVPEKTEVRSRYLGLFAQESAGDGDVGIGSRVGSLLFLHVGGEAREHLIVGSFTGTRSLVSGKEFSLLLTLQNVGTIHAVPSGEIIVRAGEREVKRFVVNEEKRKVLPDGIWQESYIVEGLSAEDIGKVTAELVGTYGVSEQELSDLTEIYYIPLPLLVGGVCIFLILLVVSILVSKRRRYIKRA